MKNTLWILIKKELARVFTDKRLVFTAFILPALSIAIIYSIMGTMLGKVFEDREEHIPSVYIQHAPEDFKEMIGDSSWREKMEVTLLKQDAPLEAIKSDIQEGNLDLLVVFDQEFKNDINNYKRLDNVPQIKTYYNSSEEYSADVRHGTFNDLFEQYERKLLGERIGNIAYTNVFDVDRDNQESNIVDERKATGKGLGMLLPMLISIFLFAGAMGIGMDSIAGEKERGTMATLLVTPVKRETIAFGKLISLGIVAFISAGSSFVGVLISLPFSSAMFGGGPKDNVDLSALQFGVTQYVQLILIMVSLVSIYVGLISLLSIIAKSVKEAGTYVTPVYMVVMISGFMNMFTTGAPKLVEFFIPVYGSVVAIKRLLSFELTWLHVGITCGVSILTTILLVALIKKMFNSEKVMFSA